MNGKRISTTGSIRRLFELERRAGVVILNRAHEFGTAHRWPECNPKARYGANPLRDSSQKQQHHQQEESQKPHRSMHDALGAQQE